MTTRNRNTAQSPPLRKKVRLGRPPKYDYPRRMINFRLSRILLQRLAKKAQTEGRAQVEVLSDILDQRLPPLNGNGELL